MTTIFIPTLQKKEFPELMLEGYKAMGLCAINYNSVFQNYMKLFYDHISGKKTEDFKGFDVITIMTIFDNFLMNVQSSDEFM